MTQAIDNVSKQARQGSVAAIIQILNDRLADDGIRTRAVLAEGILQLLCEAKTPEQLEQSTVVERIRSILEAISPRTISRVNINSRIVREQQLLWLEEVNRDPDNHLLWSELIALKKPNIFKRLFEDATAPRQPRSRLPATSMRKSLKQRYFWRGLVGGTSLCLFLGLIGWGAWRWVRQDPAPPPSAENTTPSSGTPPEAPDAASPDVPLARSPNDTASESLPPLPEDPDPFVQAVRLAEQAAADGKIAETAADWLDLASRWQRASDLMSQVPETDERYPTAQDRVDAYQQNSEAALAEAEE
ncbi:MAG: hypothetical protein AAF215_02905 [Cyanobacteria bacterium P01_A01_bin.123]